MEIILDNKTRDLDDALFIWAVSIGISIVGFIVGMMQQEKIIVISAMTMLGLIYTTDIIVCSKVGKLNWYKESLITLVPSIAFAIGAITFMKY